MQKSITRLSVLALVAVSLIATLEVALDQNRDGLLQAAITIIFPKSTTTNGVRVGTQVRTISLPTVQQSSWVFCPLICTPNPPPGCPPCFASSAASWGTSAVSSRSTSSVGGSSRSSAVASSAPRSSSLSSRASSAGSGPTTPPPSSSSRASSAGGTGGGGYDISCVNRNVCPNGWDGCRCTNDFNLMAPTAGTGGPCSSGAQSCPVNYLWDASRCQCIRTTCPTSFPPCGVGYQWDLLTCTCVSTSPIAGTTGTGCTLTYGCDSGFHWNADLCLCDNDREIDPCATRTCPSGTYWNSSYCRCQGSGQGCPYGTHMGPGNACLPNAVCGDGFVEYTQGESCDTNNSAGCPAERTCSTCKTCTACGDGFLGPSESCEADFLCDTGKACGQCQCVDSTTAISANGSVTFHDSGPYFTRTTGTTTTPTISRWDLTVQPGATYRIDSWGTHPTNTSYTCPFNYIRITATGTQQQWVPYSLSVCDGVWPDNGVTGLWFPIITITPTTSTLAIVETLPLPPATPSGPGLVQTPVSSIRITKITDATTPAPLGVTLIDDGDQGFLLNRGLWKRVVEHPTLPSPVQEPDVPFKDDYVRLDSNLAGMPTPLATWRFTVNPGTYRVHATYRSQFVPAGSSTTATFKVKDGSTEVGSIPVDQRQASSGPLYQHVRWRELGVFAIQGSALSVELSGGPLNADAVRIEEVPPACDNGFCDAGEAAVCTTCSGRVCDPPSCQPGTCPQDCPTHCSNGILESGEQCESNIGCALSNPAQVCNPNTCQCQLAFCGNAIKETGEQCDRNDSQCSSGEGCNASCQCVTASSCGDGAINQPSEQCELGVACSGANTGKNCHVASCRCYSTNGVTAMLRKVSPKIVTRGSIVRYTLTIKNTASTPYLSHRGNFIFGPSNYLTFKPSYSSPLCTATGTAPGYVACNNLSSVGANSEVNYSVGFEVSSSAPCQTALGISAEIFPTAGGSVYSNEMTPLTDLVQCTSSSSTSSSSSQASQFCGNNIIEGTEQCDDGDIQNGDGCSATCAIETGWQCTDQCTMAHTIAPNGAHWYSLSTIRHFVASLFSFSTLQATVPGCRSICTPICGDGLKRGSEQCDGPGNPCPGMQTCNQATCQCVASSSSSSRQSSSSSLSSQSSSAPPATANLEIRTLYTPPTTLERGAIITIQHGIKNNGPASVPDAQLQITPLSFEFLEAQSDSRCVLAGNAVTCTAGVLSGAQTNFTLALRLSSQPPCGSTALYQLFLTSPTVTDPNYGDNSSAVGMRVTCGNSSSSSSSFSSFSSSSSASSCLPGTIALNDTSKGMAILGNKLFAALYNDNKVDVIDLGTHTITARISVGTNPTAIAALGTKLYVSNELSNDVSVIDTATNTVVATIPVRHSPNGIMISPAGFVFVITNYGLTVIEPSTNGIRAHIDLPGSPYDVAVSGTWGFVTDSGGNTVQVVDLAHNSMTSSITVGQGPTDIALYNGKIYVANEGSNTVSVINPATKAVTNTITVGYSPTSLAFIGSKMYVASMGSHRVSIVNLNTNGVLGNIDVGSVPLAVAVTNNRLYVSENSMVLSIFDTATDTPLTCNPVSSSASSRSSSSSSQGPVRICGDGEVAPDSQNAMNITVPGEGCDDGNTVGGDGCSANCKRELDLAISGGRLNDQYGYEAYFRVANSGPNTAHGVRIRTMPISTDFYLKTQESPNCTFDAASRTIGCHSGSDELRPNTQKYFTVSLGVSPSSTVHAIDWSATAYPSVVENPYVVDTASANNTASILCGNHVIDQGEQCDDGFENFHSGSACTRDCTIRGASSSSSFSAVSCQNGILPVTGFPSGIAVSGTKVYVTNAISNTVSVIDGMTNTVTGTIPVAGSPRGIAASGTKVYAAHYGSNTISVIDRATNTVTSTIAVGSSPRAMIISGTKLYVANLFSNTISVIDTTTDTVTQTIPVGNYPTGLAVAGNTLYVANYSSRTISVINTATDAVTGTIPVQQSPFMLVAAGNQLYVGDYANNTVSIIDTVMQTVMDTIPAGNAPSALAILGDKLYVANFNDNSVSIINTTTNTVAGTMPVGNLPVALAVSGNALYVANYNYPAGANGTISIMDTTTDTPSCTVSTSSSASSAISSRSSSSSGISSLSSSSSSPTADYLCCVNGHCQLQGSPCATEEAMRQCQENRCGSSSSSSSSSSSAGALPATVLWTEAASRSDANFVGFSVLPTPSGVLRIGGIPPSGNAVKDVLLSSNGKDWAQHSTLYNPATTLGLYELSSTFFNGKAWAFGGHLGPNYMPSRTAFSWDATMGSVWQAQSAYQLPIANGLLHPAIFPFAQTGQPEQLWLLGGYVDLQDRYNGSALMPSGNTIRAYTHDGTQWNLVTSTLPLSATSANAIAFNGRMWIFDTRLFALEPTIRKIWSSVDGVHWTQEGSLPALPVGEAYSRPIVWNGMLLFLLTDSGNAIASANGRTWQAARAITPFSSNFSFRDAYSFGDTLWVYGNVHDYATNGERRTILSAALSTATTDPQCGNGTKEAGEQCEALSDCPPNNSCVICQCEAVPICGNGTVERGEQCERGVACSDIYAGQLCNENNCTCFTLPTCGNGACDAGEDVSCPTQPGGGGPCQIGSCPQDCPGVCGDGRLNQGEQCETGVNVPCATGTTCQNCQCIHVILECPSDQVEVDGQCVPTAVCGDGTINQTSEQCEQGIACSGANAGKTCNQATCQCVAPQPVCGNNVRETGEPCDDGNVLNGDGCSAACTVETGWQCTDRCGTVSASSPWYAFAPLQKFFASLFSRFFAQTPPALCHSVCTTVCGDGILAGGEQCDGASPSCGTGQTCNASCQCVAQPRCGDGMLNQASEQCEQGIACSGANAGKTCNQATCQCVAPQPVCGNGIREASEQCDGTASSCPAGQACTATCQCAPSSTPVCGNGLKEGTEQCDGPNYPCPYNQGWQECTSACQCVPSLCGNSQLNPGEECDGSGASCPEERPLCGVNCTCTLPWWPRCGDGVCQGYEQTSAQKILYPAGIPMDGEAQFGSAIAPIGDIDNDGIPDIAASAPGWFTPATGEVFLLHMRADGTVKSYDRITYPGSAPSISIMQFGSSITAVGDLDNNGVTDIAVGARGACLPGHSACFDGEVWVFLLQRNAAGTISVRSRYAITAPEGNAYSGGPGIYFGQSLAFLGNNRIAVGARNDLQRQNYGALWVYVLSATSGTSIQKNSIGEQWGTSVYAAAGDMNGDGVTDLVQTVNRGVKLLYLNTNGTVQSSQTLTIDDPDMSGAPASVTSLGDIDGNGTSDLLIGAFLQRGHFVDYGVAFKVLLEGNGREQSHRIASFQKIYNVDTAPHSFIGFGAAVAAVGDINGDGLGDYAIGVNRAFVCTGGTQRWGCSGGHRGALWMYLSGNNLPPACPFDCAPEPPAPEE